MSEYQYELAENYNHAKSILNKFLDNPKNLFYSHKIILLGVGGNGKSFLISDINSKLRKYNYRIFQDLDSDSDIVKEFLEKPINQEGYCKNLYTLNELPNCKIANAFILDMNNIRY